MSDAVQEREATALDAREQASDGGAVGARARFNAVRRHHIRVRAVVPLPEVHARSDEARWFAKLPWQAPLEENNRLARWAE